VEVTTVELVCELVVLVVLAVLALVVDRDESSETSETSETSVVEESSDAEDNPDDCLHILLHTRNNPPRSNHELKNQSMQIS